MTQCRCLIVLAIATAIVAFGCEEGSRFPEVSLRDAVIDAQSTLLQAADDKDPFTRVHAMEALAATTAQRYGGVFLQALSDDDPIVQFAAAMAVGESKYAPARDVLIRMAKASGPDKRVYAAVIYALHRLGETGFTGDLGRLLFHREAEVRASAALVMGLIGEPSAVSPLRMLLSDEHKSAVQLQAVESLARLGEEKYANLLEAYTRGHYLEDRLVAIQAMRQIRSRGAAAVLSPMLDERQPPRVRVAAAGVLAALGSGSDDAYNLCVEAAVSPRKVMEKKYGVSHKIADVDVRSLQRLAAISLGWMKRSEAVNVLHPLRKSEDGGVRVAAAMSILRILERYKTVTPAVVKPKRKDASASGRPPKRPKLHTAGGKD